MDRPRGHPVLRVRGLRRALEGLARPAGAREALGPVHGGPAAEAGDARLACRRRAQMRARLAPAPPGRPRLVRRCWPPGALGLAAAAAMVTAARPAARRPARRRLHPPLTGPPAPPAPAAPRRPATPWSGPTSSTSTACPTPARWDYDTERNRVGLVQQRAPVLRPRARRERGRARRPADHHRAAGGPEQRPRLGWPALHLGAADHARQGGLDLRLLRGARQCPAGRAPGRRSGRWAPAGVGRTTASSTSWSMSGSNPTRVFSHRAHARRLRRPAAGNGAQQLTTPAPRSTTTR